MGSVDRIISLLPAKNITVIEKRNGLSIVYWAMCPFGATVASSSDIDSNTSILIAV